MNGCLGLAVHVILLFETHEKSSSLNHEIHHDLKIFTGTCTVKHSCTVTYFTSIWQTLPILTFLTLFSVNTFLLLSFLTFKPQWFTNHVQNHHKVHNTTRYRCETWKTCELIGIIAWIWFIISSFSVDRLMYASTWNSTQQFLKITCEHCGQETDPCICLPLLPPLEEGRYSLSQFTRSST